MGGGGGEVGDTKPPTMLTVKFGDYAGLSVSYPQYNSRSNLAHLSHLKALFLAVFTDSRLLVSDKSWKKP